MHLQRREQQRWAIACHRGALLLSAWIFFQEFFYHFVWLDFEHSDVAIFFAVDGAPDE
jgi:hypothetical protein